MAIMTGMNFSDDDVRILQAAMDVSNGLCDYTALTYDEWCRAEELSDLLVASRTEIDAALAA